MNVIKYIRKPIWSPYIAGVLLGLVGIFAVWVSQSTLGASGAFENVASAVYQKAFPTYFDGNVYFRFQMKPELTWSMMLLVGVFFGGMLGAFTSGTLKWGKKDSLNSDEQWKQIFGPQVWRRWSIAFFGAIIIEISAGIAGGCTSGLAISGGMLMAPAAYLFIMAMFASGILTAVIIYRRKY